MTSARKIGSNQANARASTGPKIQRGRARAARNSFRHGLSLPVYLDPLFSKEVDELAVKIAGPDAQSDILELARRVAEAQIDLHRAQAVRHQFVNGALCDPEYESEARRREKLAVVRRCARDDGPLTPMSLRVVELLYLKPEGPIKLAMILSDKAGLLRALDRYERRALSRRKSAIRAYDQKQVELVRNLKLSK